MTTPPNPPSTPPGPPTEPAGTSIPGAAPVPAPAPTLSFDKTPAPAAPAPTAPPTDAPPASAPPADAAPAGAPAAETPAVGAPGAPASPAPPVGAPAAPTGPSPFAPPVPVPPGGPAAQGFGPGAGAPDVPGNPWAQPGPGYGPAGGEGGGYGYGYPAYPAPAPSNGQAVAALVLGIGGVLFGLVPFFFWVGTILAVVGLGLGIAALVRAARGAPRKAMAVVGTSLGVLGLAASVGGFFLTAYVVDTAADRVDRSIDEQLDPGGTDPEDEPWPGQSPSAPPPAKVPGVDSALPFGETFTYPDGVKVSLSAPKKYKPKSLYGQEKAVNAIAMTVTITNGSDKPHEVIYAVPNVRDDKGMTARLFFDGDVPKMIEGSILPGATASGIVAFEVPEGTKEVTADISAGTLLDDVQYAGPIG
ncbi:hypothetical protein GCM10010371_66690 [Streptomyces subrutilus]|uniref:DUF4190 domain-containing protein n=1 Tax=Streptomyces subrutilus TaxID=36818 RepID=A0A5P2UPN8_9ACTN|nr:DUF4190 domain-containing protein [Streptomyces subrutilus]QEU80850.1 DUF4190 domain-containing protein [Streptomyces subrutilus]GGZ97542.1 hypothetical protein GCM10010371_66690 [Streptomyces subrutilus]